MGFPAITRRLSVNEDSLRARKAAMLPDLGERQRRLFAAAEGRAAAGSRRRQ
jgi:hypothetical protein